MMTTRNKWGRLLHGIFAERHLGTGVSVWILCSPLERRAATNQWERTARTLSLHLKKPFIGVLMTAADVWGASDWQVQIELSIHWNTFHQHVKKTLHTEQKSLKFHMGYDKSNDTIHPRYPITKRARAAFISTFKAFIWMKFKRKIQKNTSINLRQPEFK